LNRSNRSKLYNTELLIAIIAEHMGHGSSVVPDWWTPLADPSLLLFTTSTAYVHAFNVTSIGRAVLSGCKGCTRACVIGYPFLCHLQACGPVHVVSSLLK